MTKPKSSSGISTKHRSTTRQQALTNDAIEFQRQMKVARQIMAEDHEALAKLAKL